ncbi:MAG: glycosyltransferase family 39 protein [Tepidisphaeraceae bacterium]|jgi:uncharacterized membrane protein
MSPTKKLVVSWAILAGLIALGAGLRFHQITKVGLWPDEFWSSVHLATGRGAAVLDLPAGVLFDPPPPTLLQGAPPWWHVWTGLAGIVHPPVYLILLRWWMDAFGSGDFSTRAFSAVASLAGIVVLFDVLRRTVSLHAALLGAAFMAISPMQINLSQQTRPYPLLALFGLLACQVILRIERQGACRGRLIQLGLAMAAMALTHYFSLGGLLAISAYALIRLRGADRRRTIAAIGIAGAIVLICWGPFLWQQHREFFRQQSWSLEPSSGAQMPLIRAAAQTAAFLFGRPGGEMAWLAPCVIAYLLPLIFLRRLPQLMLWWLWIVGIVGLLVAYDSINHARLLAYDKYTSLASVALYALCAVPWPMGKWPRWVIPYLLLTATAIATVQRIQEGPSEDNGDWRTMAVTLDRLAAPGDPLVFYPSDFWGPPGMYYLAVAHYARSSHRPIMFLTQPADPAAERQLSKFRKIWLVGPSAGQDGADYLPGWSVLFNRGFPNSGSIAEMEKAGRRTTTR